MSFSAVIKHSARYVRALTAVIIISYALLILLGRELLPQLEHQQTRINHFLSEQFAINMSSAHFGGNWERLSPQLWMQGLSISAQDTASPPLIISNIASELHFFDSVFARTPIWHELSIGQVSLTAKQSEDGSWSLAGFPLKSTTDDHAPQIEKWLKTALLSTHIGIDKIALQFDFFNAAPTTLLIHDIHFENKDNFHRARARLAVEDGQDSAELLIESHSTPGNLTQLKSQAYLHFKHLDTQGPLGSTLREFIPAIAENTSRVRTQVNGEFWLNLTKLKQLSLVGNMQADEIALQPPNQALPAITNLSADVKGQFTTNEGRNLQLSKLQLTHLKFTLDGADVDPLNLSLEQELGPQKKTLKLAIEHIDLDAVKQLILQTQLGGQNITSLFETLQPSGTINKLHLSLDFEAPHVLTELHANIDQLAINSWHGAPAVRNLRGYLHWQDTHGFFDLDTPEGFSLLFPTAYDNYMDYGSAKGRINIDWHTETSGLRIAAAPLDINGAEGQIRTYLSLDIPIGKTQRDPEMFLQIGIKNSHSRYRQRYLPRTLNPDLLAWLERAVGSTDIVEGGFIWRGSLIGKHEKQRSIQFSSSIANGQLNYDPSWPALSNIKGSINIDNTRFTGVLEHANLNQATLHTASIKTHTGAFLSIQADISSPVDDAINILLVSPLAHKMSALERWQLAGEANIKLDLMIPLSKEQAPKTQTSNQQKNHVKQPSPAYRVTTQISHGQMHHTELPDLIFKQVNGEIAYTDDKGLYSPGLTATLWDQPFSTTITTFDDATEIYSTGLVDFASMPAWHPFIRQAIHGKTTYAVKVTAPSDGSAPRLSLSSNLQGISIDLPEPAGKTAAQHQPFEASLQFNANSLSIEAQTNAIYTHLNLSGSHLINGMLLFGKNPYTRRRNPVRAHEFLIKGQLDNIDIARWSTALSPFHAHEKAPHTKSSTPFLNTQVSLSIKDVAAAGMHLNNVQLKAYRTEDLWSLYINSPQLAGNIAVPSSQEKPISIDLKHLHLPKLQLKGKGSTLQNFSPSTLPNLNFSSKNIRLGDRELGTLAFTLRGIEQGIRINHIQGTITGAQIINHDADNPSQLRWLISKGQHQTYLSAAVKTQDVNDVMKAWGMPKLLDSKQALFQADMRWSGKPWDVSAPTLNGQLNMHLKEGEFFQTPGTTTNTLLKVVGLINFDTWLRRLKFDFSDIFSSGVSYDHLRGGLAFDAGNMYFNKPITVDLSSGKLRLEGSTHLVEETIDAHLTATLPVSANLPWVAALVGGLPVAAGVYITQQIFEKQLEQISSINYNISGNWDEPDIKVGRIIKRSKPKPLVENTPRPTPNPATP